MTALIAGLAPAAQAAFGVTEGNFEAGTCINHTCTYSSVEANPKEAFTQSAGHPQWGITTFELNHTGSGTTRVPEGALKRIRVDVPPGLAANPEALPKCKRAQFDVNACPLASEVGTTELEVNDGVTVLPVSGKVYNLEPSPGLPLDFGIDVGVEPLVHEHLFLEGHVAWWSDYHEYFEIDNVPKEGKLLGLPVTLRTLKSKLNFDGRANGKNFLTLPSVCSSSTTSYLEVESYEGAISRTPTHTPVGVEGCDKVPFAPSVTVAPATQQSDSPDGAMTVVQVPQKVNETETNTSDVRDAHVTLPEGLTLNPAAAHGLEACTPEQIGIGSTAPVACPAGSRVGSLTIETDLPPGSLTGSVFLGGPAGKPITDPPYTIYLAAGATGVDPKTGLEGVSVRLQGTVEPNRETGRLEVSFANNPQLPFGELRLTLNGGEHAPLANPLACGPASTDFDFTPYTGGAAAIGSTPFETVGCPSPLSFSLSQSTTDSPPNAGAFGSTAFTFNLARADGQQYLSKLTTVLPPGLVGAIPSVTQCGEPQAQSGACPAGSQIGTATAYAGAGDPYPFSGPVYFTGPYASSPFGLSIPIHAAAGPFDLGTIVTRVAINVDPHSGRVITSSTLPTIFKGVPLRVRNISVAVNRPNFLLNPTNCGELHTESTLTSTFNATSPASSPFQVTNCSALAFKPKFTAATNAKATKKNGASLKVTMTQPPHEANLHSVVASLPLQLPSRLTTLQKACLQATFDANPAGCGAAKVGTATAVTPVLPTPLTGSAYLVSHGGAAFPDLDLVLDGSGVRVILVGNTNIKNGITTSTFASIPDVPVTKFTLDLATGPNSALTAFGGLCARPLVMPTTMTAQNGAQIKQNTRISVSGCGVRIVSRRVRAHKLVLKVRAPSAGRASVRAKGLRRVSKRVRKAATITFKLPLTRGGLSALHRHRPLKVKVRVSFAPSNKSEGRSAASTTVKFKH